MQEFQFAAARAEKPDEALVIEIPFPTRTLISRAPTPAEVSMFNLRSNGLAPDKDPYNGFIPSLFKLLDDILAPGDVEYLKEMLFEGKITIGTLFGGDDANAKGLINVILAEVSGRPTQPSSGSSSSPDSSGPKSTGRAPSRKSTSSGSPSTDS